MNLESRQLQSAVFVTIIIQYNPLLQNETKDQNQFLLRMEIWQAVQRRGVETETEAAKSWKVNHVIVKVHCIYHKNLTFVQGCVHFWYPLYLTVNHSVTAPSPGVLSQFLWLFVTVSLDRPAPSYILIWIGFFLIGVILLAANCPQYTAALLDFVRAKYYSTKRVGIGQFVFMCLQGSRNKSAPSHRWWTGMATWEELSI